MEISRELSNFYNRRIRTDLEIFTLALLEQPAHGYKIINVMNRELGSDLSPGTMYPLLYKLEADGLISIEEDERRKIYKTTEKGRRKLAKLGKMRNAYEAKISKFLDFHKVKLDEEEDNAIKTIQENLRGNEVVIVSRHKVLREIL